MTGTGLYTLLGSQSANHYAGLIDDEGYVMLGKFDTAATPDTTANVFQAGCLMAKTDETPGNRTLYQNYGTLAAPNWLLMA